MPRSCIDLGRRGFFRAVAGGGTLLWALRVQVAVFAVGRAGEARAEKVYDLVMECWSTLGGGRLGSQKEPLTAGQIIAGKAMPGIVYNQDDHGHTFDLTEQHMKDLLGGRVVSVITTEAQGHTHEVRIDPQDRANDAGIERPSGADAPTTVPPGANAAEPGSLRELLDQHCTECHHTGAPAAPDLTKTVGAEQVAKILESVTSSDPRKLMPPGFRRKLSAPEIERLKILLK